ncbi:hypothetical protein CY34DRAFT_506950 [Suillus luteus UH-Slu-Lm8-n1]|uniref:Uncharacterized protein n=1 Tax=Suillus luteus UH-Slu-Lm8-n1 TaxID=930992 RepID=A0A0D0BHM9_9AGAM|nr:hypothetical protein CY34DRAFT_506950 [Suillus luteus UH-Slu-Lm8-n1]
MVDTLLGRLPASLEILETCGRLILILLLSCLSLHCVYLGNMITHLDTCATFSSGTCLMSPE